MTLAVNEVNILMEQMINKLKREVLVANMNNQIENIIRKYGYTQDNNSYFYYNTRNAKIIVIGHINRNVQEVEKCLKDIGIDKNSVEFYSDYTKLKKINFSFLKNNANYSDILVCAMPHKMSGIDGYNSFVSMVENNQDEFPTLTRIGNMRYSNTAFKKALLKTNFYQNMLSYC